MLSLSRYSQKKKYKKVTKVTEVLQGSVYNWLLPKNILTLDAVYARDKSVKLHVYYLVPTDKQTDYKHRCLAMTGGGVTLELRRISNVATERRLHVTVNRKSRIIRTGNFFKSPTSRRHETSKLPPSIICQ